MTLTYFTPVSFLSALVIAGTIGCSGTADGVPGPGAGVGGSTAGAGGAATGTGGAATGGGTGGEGAVVCDCSLAALGCGSSLAEAAEAAGCVIPLLPEHDGDLGLSPPDQRANNAL